MKYLLLAAIAAFVIGCATTEVPVSQSKPVPAERVFYKSQVDSAEGARAVFIRDVGMVGAATYKHLFINNAKAASLDPGERVEFVLVPGEYIFGVIPTAPFGVSTVATIDQELKPGRTYYYRLFTDGNSYKPSIQRYIPAQ